MFNQVIAKAKVSQKTFDLSLIKSTTKSFVGEGISSATSGKRSRKKKKVCSISIQRLTASCWPIIPVSLIDQSL